MSSKQSTKRHRQLIAPVGSAQREVHPLAEAVGALGIDLPMLREILKKDTDEMRLKAAGLLMESKGDKFPALLAQVLEQFQVIRESSLLVRGFLQIPENVKRSGTSPGYSEILIKQTLAVLLRSFRFVRPGFLSDFVFHRLGDEIDPVEVFRISPDDVQSSVIHSQSTA